MYCEFVLLLPSTILAIVFAAEMSFPGGKPNEFAVALAKAKSTPVIVMRGDGAKIEPFNIKPSDDDLFRHYLKLFTGMDLGLDSTGCGPAAWPDYLIVYTRRGSASERWSPDDQDIPIAKLTPDGELTIKLENSKNFRLDRLAEVLPKGLIKLHWFYGYSILTASKQTWQSDTFWQSVSVAVGAKYVKSGGSVELQFDPVVYRKRMIARLDRQLKLASKEKRSAYEVSDLRFQREAFRVSSNAELTKAMAGGSSYALVRVPHRSTLWNSMLDRLEHYARRTDIFQNDPKALTPNELANSIDFDRPVYAHINSSHRVTVWGMLKGKQSSAVNF